MSRSGDWRRVFARAGVVAVVAVTTAAVGLGGVAQAASGDKPTEGQPCSSADVRTEVFRVDSSTTEPVITHFSAVNISDGSSQEQSYRVENQRVVTTELDKSVEASAGVKFGLIAAEAGVKTRLSVKTIKTQTEINSTTVTWRFNQAGYYGLYKGVYTVSGDYSTLRCTSVNGKLQWTARPGGTYKTFTNSEEGTIKCGDSVPAKSLREVAQGQLCRDESPGFLDPDRLTKLIFG